MMESWNFLDKLLEPCYRVDKEWSATVTRPPLFCLCKKPVRDKHAADRLFLFALPNQLLEEGQRFNNQRQNCDNNQPENNHRSRVDYTYVLLFFFTNFQKFCAEVLNSSLYFRKISSNLPFF